MLYIEPKCCFAMTKCLNPMSSSNPVQMLPPPRSHPSFQHWKPSLSLFSDHGSLFLALPCVLILFFFFSDMKTVGFYLFIFLGLIFYFIFVCVLILNVHMYLLSLLSSVQLFVTPWTVAHQAFLFMKFSRQECWIGLPFPAPRDLPNSGSEPTSLMFPALAGRFFTTSATWEAQFSLPRIIVTHFPTRIGS